MKLLVIVLVACLLIAAAFEIRWSKFNWWERLFLTAGWIECRMWLFKLYCMRRADERRKRETQNTA